MENIPADALQTILVAAMALAGGWLTYRNRKQELRQDRTSSAVEGHERLIDQLQEELETLRARYAEHLEAEQAITDRLRIRVTYLEDIVSALIAQVRGAGLDPVMVPNGEQYPEGFRGPD